MAMTMVVRSIERRTALLTALEQSMEGGAKEEL
jgi:hypothetical protein